MKVSEITHYKLFVDLDGVMCDLYNFIYELTGSHFTDDNKEDEHIWKQVNAYQEAGNPTFSILNKMPDADVLWEYVKPYNPAILTATGKLYDYGRKEKVAWVEKHLSGYSDIITVTTSREKAKYAKDNHILIDDRHKSIDPWREAGGIGILHTDAQNTIRQLKKLGI
jgi:hypothetical protein